MSQVTTEKTAAVPPEEVARRIGEMRRLAFQAKSPAQVVYHPPEQHCPWPGCSYRIAAIVFHLEEIVMAEQLDEFLAAWWLGPGLLARCPGCRQLVLYDVLRKEAITDMMKVKAPQLPDDWHEKAYLLHPGGR